MTKKCDEDYGHYWEYEQGWKDHIKFDTCLRIPIKCSNCGMKADETWTDFIVTDKETGEIIE